MPRRPALAALCERAGVLPDYSEAGTGLRRRVSDPTRAALLAAMGWDASTEAAARASRAAWGAERAARLIEPVAVEPPGRGRRRLRVCVPSEARGPLDWELVVHLESGQELRRAGRTRRRPVLGLPLPGARETGYHRVELTLCDARGSWRAEQRRIAVPARCVGPAEKLGAPGARAFGLWTHLYAVRGARGTGAGEFGDLRRLCRLAGTGGADFVGLNPLHALWNRGAAVSPYAPVSRLYRNDLYLDLEAVPEQADGPDLLAGRRRRNALTRLRAADRIDYDAIRALRRPVLETLHRRFVRRHGGGTTARGRAYRRYRAREGEPLDDFATFVAIAEQRGQRRQSRWPRSSAIATKVAKSSSASPSRAR